MSSLPPYNQRLGERAVWIYPLVEGTDLPPWRERWGAVVADNEQVARAARRVYPGVPVTVLIRPDQLVAPGSSWMLAAGHPAWCEVVLRRLMGMPDGTATFALQAGALSIVDLLPDHPVLTRLNHGRALT